MKKFLLLFVTISFGLTKAFTQLNFQAFGSYVLNLNKDYKGSAYGAGIRFEFGSNDAFMNKYVGFAYNAPIATHVINEAHAYSSLTDPQSIEVPTVYKIANYRLETGGRFYLSGAAHNYEGINTYLSGGVELIFAPKKPQHALRELLHLCVGQGHRHFLIPLNASARPLLFVTWKLKLTWRLGSTPRWCIGEP